MKVAVVGAGWAGLAAAVRLHRDGCDVRIYEAAAQPGGRARRVRHPALGIETDNGQHLLLGAYRATLDLMRSLGVDPGQACDIRPLALESADRRLRLAFWPLPAPAHRLGVLCASRGLEGWRGRRHLWRTFRALDPDRIDPGLDAAAWLRRLGCPPGLLERLWAPLCLAATNTPLEDTEAALLARVLRDSLGAGAAASRLVIPRAGLDELWPRQARDLLGERLRRQRVLQIAARPGGGWEVDGEPSDRVILATPPGEARRLIGPLPGADTWLRAWPDWRHAAIGTLSLRLERPWRSGHALALLRDDPARDAWGQWLFDRSEGAAAAGERRLAHVVIGRADRYAGRDTAAVAAGVLAQIAAQVRTPLPPVEAWALITEKRATFDVTPGLRRPGPATPWDGLLLAGDWTDTGYPAVLEGAVRSGLRAAALASAPGAGDGGGRPARAGQR
jgi:squalene-associated FAD-dependent desaturase